MKCASGLRCCPLMCLTREMLHRLISCVFCQHFAGFYLKRSDKEFNFTAASALCDITAITILTQLYVSSKETLGFIPLIAKTSRVIEGGGGPRQVQSSETAKCNRAGLCHPSIILHPTIHSLGWCAVSKTLSTADPPPPPRHGVGTRVKSVSL